MSIGALFDFLQNAGLFVILFGVLVFIHELGHFLAAKWVGIGVEKFFVGFGPTVFSLKKGETEYGIKWIPLGGYVKLMGEEPGEETEKKIPKEKSFMSKTPLQRMAVVTAGPISNLLLPIILFACLFFVGVPALAPVVGEVVVDSPADNAGLLQGDRIEEVQGRKVFKWDELTGMIRESGGKRLEFLLDRSGEKLNLGIDPKLTEVQNIFRETVEGWTIGITPYQHEPSIGIVNKPSLAYDAGLRTGDIIRKVNGIAVDYYWQFERSLKGLKPGRFDLAVERGKDKDKQVLSFALQWGRSFKEAKDLGIYRSDLFVASVKQGSIASQKGIEKGDMIISVQGKKANSFMDIEKMVKDKAGPINIVLMRGTKTLKVDLTPKMTPSKDVLTGAHEERPEIGIEPLIVAKEPPAYEVVEKTLNPIKAVYLGADKTVIILWAQIVGFAKLIQGQLSVKNIGGPILIYKLAGRSFEVGGIFSFISYIALLSIVLGFVNLLPIPIMDGGHVVFCLIEMIKRKPLSLRVREIAQQVGFAIVIGLMLLATYNDIKRYFLSGMIEFFKKVF